MGARRLRVLLSWYATKEEIRDIKRALPSGTEVAAPPERPHLSRFEVPFDELKTLAARADAIMGWVLPAGILELAARLKVLIWLHAGCDELDLKLLKKRKVKVANARGGNAIADVRQILKFLRERKADGLIVYKVDRSARNLKDWADLGELIDQGIPVYFASDDLDMSSRGGRLAADIQAVVAADFIRNLREEAKLGIRKRLEQGLRPNGAPIGYLDRGKAKPKEIDPEKGPLVRLAFTWYATGAYTLETLGNLLFDLGFRNRFGGRVTTSGLSHLFRNPFYIGYLAAQATKELLPGRHVPLVERSLFFAVQAKLRSKVQPRRLRHHHRYSRLLRCETCRKSLIASRVKGHIYYRCATKSCPTTSVREEMIDAVVGLQSTPPERTAPIATVSGKLIVLIAPDGADGKVRFNSSGVGAHF